MADDPSLFDQFEQWYANSRDTDALDPKTKALVGLAVGWWGFLRRDLRNP